MGNEASQEGGERSTPQLVTQQSMPLPPPQESPPGLRRRGSAGPPLAAGVQVDLSNLSEEERAAILSVMARAQSLEEPEEGSCHLCQSSGGHSPCVECGAPVCGPCSRNIPSGKKQVRMCIRCAETHPQMSSNKQTEDDQKHREQATPTPRARSDSLPSQRGPPQQPGGPRPQHPQTRLRQQSEDQSRPKPQHPDEPPEHSSSSSPRKQQQRPREAPPPSRQQPHPGDISQQAKHHPGQTSQSKQHSGEVPQQVQKHPGQIPQQSQQHPGDVPQAKQHHAMKQHPVDVPQPRPQHPEDMTRPRPQHPGDPPQQRPPYPGDSPQARPPHPQSRPQHPQQRHQIPGNAAHPRPQHPGEIMHQQRPQPGEVHQSRPQHPGDMSQQRSHSGDMMQQKPQHPGEVPQSRPQHPGDMMQQRPQHPGEVPQSRPQHPGDVMQQRPQHAGDMMQQRPQHPGEVPQSRPQHPGDMTQQRPHHPGEVPHTRPQHPGDALQAKVQHPSEHVQPRPQYPGDHTQVRPQHPGEHAQPRPQHPMDHTQHRPQHPMDHTQKRPQHPENHIQQQRPQHPENHVQQQRPQHPGEISQPRPQQHAGDVPKPRLQHPGDVPQIKPQHPSEISPGDIIQQRQQIPGDFQQRQSQQHQGDLSQRKQHGDIAQIKPQYPHEHAPQMRQPYPANIPQQKHHPNQLPSTRPEHPTEITELRPEEFREINDQRKEYPKDRSQKRHLETTDQRHYPNDIIQPKQNHIEEFDLMKHPHYPEEYRETKHPPSPDEPVRHKQHVEDMPQQKQYYGPESHPIKQHHRPEPPQIRHADPEVKEAQLAEFSHVKQHPDEYTVSKERRPEDIFEKMDQPHDHVPKQTASEFPQAKQQHMEENIQAKHPLHIDESPQRKQVHHAEDVQQRLPFYGDQKQPVEHVQMRRRSIEYPGEISQLRQQNLERQLNGEVSQVKEHNFGKQLPGDIYQYRQPNLGKQHNGDIPHMRQQKIDKQYPGDVIQSKKQNVEKLYPNEVSQTKQHHLEKDRDTSEKPFSSEVPHSQAQILQNHYIGDTMEPKEGMEKGQFEDMFQTKQQVLDKREIAQTKEPHFSEMHTPMQQNLDRDYSNETLQRRQQNVDKHYTEQIIPTKSNNLDMHAEELALSKQGLDRQIYNEMPSDTRQQVLEKHLGQQVSHLKQINLEKQGYGELQGQRAYDKQHVGDQTYARHSIDVGQLKQHQYGELMQQPNDDFATLRGQYTGHSGTLTQQRQQPKTPEVLPPSPRRKEQPWQGDEGIYVDLAPPRSRTNPFRSDTNPFRRESLVEAGEYVTVAPRRRSFDAKISPEADGKPKEGKLAEGIPRTIPLTSVTSSVEDGEDYLTLIENAIGVRKPVVTGRGVREIQRQLLDKTVVQLPPQHYLEEHKTQPVSYEAYKASKDVESEWSDLSPIIDVSPSVEEAAEHDLSSRGIPRATSGTISGMLEEFNRALGLSSPVEETPLQKSPQKQPGTPRRSHRRLPQPTVEQMQAAVAMAAQSKPQQQSGEATEKARPVSPMMPWKSTDSLDPTEGVPKPQPRTTKRQDVPNSQEAVPVRRLRSASYGGSPADIRFQKPLENGTVPPHSNGDVGSPQTPGTPRDKAGDSSDTQSEAESIKSVRLRRELPNLPREQAASPTRKKSEPSVSPSGEGTKLPQYMQNLKQQLRDELKAVTEERKVMLEQRGKSPVRDPQEQNSGLRPESPGLQVEPVKQPSPTMQQRSPTMQQQRSPTMQQRISSLQQSLAQSPSVPQQSPQPSFQQQIEHPTTPHTPVQPAPQHQQTPLQQMQQQQQPTFQQVHHPTIQQVQQPIVQHPSLQQIQHYSGIQHYQRTLDPYRRDDDITVMTTATTTVVSSTAQEPWYEPATTIAPTEPLRRAAPMASPRKGRRRHTSEISVPPFPTMEQSTMSLQRTHYPQQQGYRTMEFQTLDPRMGRYANRTPDVYFQTLNNEINRLRRSSESLQEDAPQERRKRKGRKPRSWHPSPYVSEDEEDALSREEKKAKVKAEIARRRRHIEQNMRLHEELSKLAERRQRPADDTNSVLRAIDEILRKDLYSGGSYYAAHRYEEEAMDESIARIASTFPADEPGGGPPDILLSSTPGRRSPDATPAMPLLPDMPTRSRKLLENLGSSPIQPSYSTDEQVEEEPMRFQEEARVLPFQRSKKYDFPVKRILLTRDPKDRSVSGNGLGMKVVGGKEVPGSEGTIGAYVAKIFPGGVVETLGEVKEGDQVLEWNGIPLTGRTYEEVQRIIASSADEVEIVIRCDLNMLETLNHTRQRRNSPGTGGPPRSPGGQSPTRGTSYSRGQSPSSLGKRLTGGRPMSSMGLLSSCDAIQPHPGFDRSFSSRGVYSTAHLRDEEEALLQGGWHSESDVEQVQLQVCCGPRAALVYVPVKPVTRRSLPEYEPLLKNGWSVDCDLLERNGKVSLYFHGLKGNALDAEERRPLTLTLADLAKKNGIVALDDRPNDLPGLRPVFVNDWKKPKKAKNDDNNNNSTSSDHNYPKVGSSPEATPYTILPKGCRGSFCNIL